MRIRYCDPSWTRRAYTLSEPFPHVVIDNLFHLEDALTLSRSFPPVDATHAKRFHLHSAKYTTTDVRGPLREALDVLQGPSFLSWLEPATGEKGLMPDPELRGAGVHQSLRGGFLDIHADFTVHPQKDARRILNLLVYLNPVWPERWGGALELWDAGMTRCVQRIPTAFNRAVLFETSAHSFHGHPDRLRCPKGIARQSLALYYYRPWQSEDEPRLLTTDYRNRPQDRGKRLRKWVLDWARTRESR